jgi:hydrogenase/urease accessory protein HupE
MLRLTVLALLVYGALLSGVASAHEVKPALLQLTEVAEGRYDILWKRPLSAGRVVAINPRLNGDILDTTPFREIRGAGAETRVWRELTLDLSSATLRIAGLEHTITDVLVSVHFLNGDSIRAVLTPEEPELHFNQHSLASVYGYLQLGFRHILGGPDHLLFVFALLLLLRGIPVLVKTITAFTVAHSISLALITLNLVQPRIALVEALVALSIVYVAVEVVHLYRGQRGLTQRYPWLIALVFGLLHGSAFGGELVQIGLPAGDVAAALLLFNLGIEGGQLLFIVAVLTAHRLFRQALLHLPQWLKWLPPYAVGSAGAFWFFQRINDALPYITTS